MAGEEALAVSLVNSCREESLRVNCAGLYVCNEEVWLVVVACCTSDCWRSAEDGCLSRLAAAILRIQSEPELGKTLVARAQDRLAGFRIEHTALMYEHIYKSVQSSPALRQHAPPASSTTGSQPRSTPP